MSLWWNCVTEFSAKIAQIIPKAFSLFNKALRSDISGWCTVVPSLSKEVWLLNKASLTYFRISESRRFKRGKKAMNARDWRFLARRPRVKVAGTFSWLWKWANGLPCFWFSCRNNQTHRASVAWKSTDFQCKNCITENLCKFGNTNTGQWWEASLHVSEPLESQIRSQ